MNGHDVQVGTEATLVCFGRYRPAETHRRKARVAHVRHDSEGRIIELYAQDELSGIPFRFFVDEKYMARLGLIRVDLGRIPEGKLFMMPPDDFGTGAYLVGAWPMGTTPRDLRSAARIVVGSDGPATLGMSPMKAPLQGPSPGVALFAKLFGRLPRLEKRGPARGDVAGTIDAIAMRLLEDPNRCVIAGHWVKWSDVVAWTSDAGRDARAVALRTLEVELGVVEQRPSKPAIGRPGVELRIVMPE